MEAYITNPSNVVLAYVENFRSFIWTERYSAFGDFVLVIASDSPLLGPLQPDNYIVMVDSPYSMIIEDILIVKNKDENYAKITGRSLESILDRRQIVQDIMAPSATALEVLFSHVDWELANVPGGDLYPVQKEIPGFTVDETKPAGVVERATYDYEFKGKSLYELVKTICDDHDLGFRIIQTPNSTNMRFSLYRGVDRTVTPNPVTYSLNLQNMKSLSYLKTRKTERNVAIVDLAPNEYLSEKFIVTQPFTNPSGLRRREMIVDGTRINEFFPPDLVPDRTNARNMAQIKGQQEIRESKMAFFLDAEVEPTKEPKYRNAFNLGDIVLMYNSIDVQTKYRVTEYIRAYTDTGSLEYPTYEAIID